MAKIRKKDKKYIKKTGYCHVELQKRSYGAKNVHSKKTYKKKFAMVIYKIMKTLHAKSCIVISEVKNYKKKAMDTVIDVVQN